MIGWRPPQRLISIHENTIATAKTTFEMTTIEIDELLVRELEHARQQGDTRRVREIEVSLGRHR